jgi:hypothetical protein
MVKRKVRNSKTKSSKKDNKIVRLILIIVMILAVGVLLGAVSHTLIKMYEYKAEARKIISYHIFNSSVEITPSSVGLNADRDGIKFGKVNAGGGGTRFLDINSDEDAIVQVFIAGNMTGMISVEDNNFLIQAGEPYSLPVNLDVPEGTPIGFYNGEVHVILMRP